MSKLVPVWAEMNTEDFGYSHSARAWGIGLFAHPPPKLLMKRYSHEMFDVSSGQHINILGLT
jgi:hypothetical protein